MSSTATLNHTIKQRRLRILGELSSIPLPAYIGPPTPPDDLYCLNDMIADEWIEGYPLPHSSGSGFACIQVVRIREGGLQAIADGKFATRAKRVTASTWKIIASVIGFIVLLLSGIPSIQKILEWRHAPANPTHAITSPQPPVAPQSVTPAANQTTNLSVTPKPTK